VLVPVLKREPFQSRAVAQGTSRNGFRDLLLCDLLSMPFLSSLLSPASRPQPQSVQQLYLRPNWSSAPTTSMSPRSANLAPTTSTKRLAAGAHSLQRLNRNSGLTLSAAENKVPFAAKLIQLYHFRRRSSSKDWLDLAEKDRHRSSDFSGLYPAERVERSSPADLLGKLAHSTGRYF